MKEKLVLLTGPTAVGKTAASIAVARALKGEIVSADSMQIYKRMDIGTAKASPVDMEGIPHHLIDILEPNEEFSAGIYKIMAQAIIRDINKRNNIPILTGGTGLYINSLVYDLDFGGVPPDEEYRAELDHYYLEHGGGYLLEMLQEIDSKTASRLGPKDYKRIVRALEVFRFTGIPLSSQVNSFRKENENYDLAMYCLTMERSKLYERINMRVDTMINAGLVNEVKQLLDLGYDSSMVSMQGIGYKEICGYLNGVTTWESAVDKIKQGSRNYAKRQLTWFRRDNRIKWIDVDSFNSKEELHHFIIEDVRNTLYREEGQS